MGTLIKIKELLVTLRGHSSRLQHVQEIMKICYISIESFMFLNMNSILEEFLNVFGTGVFKVEQEVAFVSQLLQNSVVI